VSMINLDFEDRFEKLDNLLSTLLPPVKKGELVANYHTPNKLYRSYCVLARDSDTWFNPAIVIHGHDNSKRFCLWSDYCHVEGYRPTGKERPSFIEGFYKKWPQYEG
jgi:hypothetical protein